MRKVFLCNNIIMLGIRNTIHCVICVYEKVGKFSALTLRIQLNVSYVYFYAMKVHTLEAAVESHCRNQTTMTLLTVTSTYFHERNHSTYSLQNKYCHINCYLGISFNYDPVHWRVDASVAAISLIWHYILIPLFTDIIKTLSKCAPL